MEKVLGFFFIASLVLMQGFIAGALWEDGQTASEFYNLVKSKAQPVEIVTFGPAILLVLTFKIFKVSFK